MLELIRLEVGMNMSIPSGIRPRHPGLPTETLFKLFKAAIKDDEDTGDALIQTAYQDMVSYDYERARTVMELVVRRESLARDALYGLLAEARDLQPSAGLPPEYYEGHILH
jgi:hypothetical protein